MKIQTTRIYAEIQKAKDAGFTTVSEQGSSRSSKTFNTVIWIILRCLYIPKTTVSVVRATLPAIKGSVFRDFKEIMIKMKVWDDRCMNKSDFIYSFPNGSWVEFFSCDNEQKIRGRKRKILYVNEGNELKFIEWQQLQMRTTEFSIIDYNPSFTEDHWLCTLNKEKTTYHFITTYKDNPFLEQKVIDEIESLQWKNPSLWRVYGLGLQAIIEGLIFENVEYVDEIPLYAKKKAWIGMDLGYTCFRGDTMITTVDGDISIKDVKIGDYVLTTKGYRKVLRKHNNGIKKVLGKKISIAGKDIVFHATGNHLFKSNGKWKKYEELTKKDNLYVLLNLKGTNIKGIQVGNTQTITTTSGKRTECTIAKCFITQFMSLFMALFQKVNVCTTKTKTLSITALKTLSWYLKANMQNCIARSSQDIKQEKTPLGCVLQKIIGIRDEILSSTTSLKNEEYANTVKENTLQQMCINDSAAKSVTIDGNIQQNSAKLNSSVNGAAENFKGINISNQKPARPSALISCQPIKEITPIGEEYCEVFDLEVEGVHEYFANGVCVHNCDPTAIVEVCLYDDTIYIDEVCYQTKMLSSDITGAIKEKNRKEKRQYKVISESADPRLIDEVYNAGIDIHPVKKFGGSIMAGIQKMQEFKIKVTKRSTNIRKEFNNYTYRQDKEGKWLNEPIDAWNHGLDAIRYVILEEVLGGYGQGLSAEELADIL